MKKTTVLIANSDLQKVVQLINSGQLDIAERAVRAILLKNPINADALRLLGDVYFLREDYQPAFDCYQRSLSLRVSFETVKGLAAAAELLRMLEFAEKQYRTLIRLNPKVGESYYRLAEMLILQAKHPEEIISCLEKAIAHKCQPERCYNRLGFVWQWLAKNRDMARSSYLKALEIAPDYTDALANLATLYLLNNHIEDALELVNRALEVDPNRPDLYQLFSNSLLKLGRQDECRQFYLRAVQLAPTNPIVYGSYLFSTNYSDTLSQDEWFEEHKKFGEIADAVATPFTEYPNSIEPERKLRVGYVSADFKSHSVAFFFEPLLENYDKEKFEIYCYYNYRTHDEVTARLKSRADAWRDTIYMNNQELVDQIREDQIDLLIDLTGHTADTRLAVFAWKAAPVQFTWLGYGPTTGMKSIDYIFTDKYYVPDESAARYYTEKPVFLKNYRVFKPSLELPVKPLPALEKGYVTFGSFNSFIKVSADLLALWNDLLHQIPDSRLSIIVHARESVDYVKEFFTSRGIAEERLMIFNKLRYDHFLQLHYHVDIALDSYPFTGFTTSFNGLWMGVPMITLVGPRMVSRTGLGLLAQLGLEEFVSYSREEYIEKARYWAGNLERLAEIRNGLREQMRQSSLMDGVAFTRDFEHILRDCWQRWCADQAGKTLPT